MVDIAVVRARMEGSWDANQLQAKIEMCFASLKPQTRINPSCRKVSSASCQLV